MSPRPTGAALFRPPQGRRFDVVGMGVGSVDHLCVVRRQPRLDSKQQLVAYERQPGGQVPTALVALQRWGLRTAFLGAFGTDPGGVLSHHSLADEGVDVSACRILPNVAQGISVILVDEVSGERSVLWQQRAELVLKADDVPSRFIGAAAVLLMDAVDIPAAVVAAQAAKAESALTVLDIDTPSAGVEELLRLTDVLIVGVDFPARLTGCGDLRGAMRQAAKLGPWFVAVTLGPGGVLALVHGVFHYVPAFRLSAVDSTGAGDVFHAGSIYGLLQGWSVPEILSFAAAAAALKCQRLGGRPGIPSLDRALTLARSHRT